MSRNTLYAVIGVLAIALIGLAGIYAYQQSQQPRLEITVDKSGIEVNGNG